MTNSDERASASELVDAMLADLGDWRGETLARVRALIHGRTQHERVISRAVECVITSRGASS
jgi:hypothetical protein